MNEGDKFPKDSFLEKIYRGKGDMSIHEIANNLVRTADGSKIAFKQPGRADVEQGEASVYNLRAIIGDGMLRQILENLPEAEF